MSTPSFKTILPNENFLMYLLTREQRKVSMSLQFSFLLVRTEILTWENKGSAKEPLEVRCLTVYNSLVSDKRVYYEQESSIIRNFLTY